MYQRSISEICRLTSQEIFENVFKSGTISVFAFLVWAAFGLEYGFSEDFSIDSLETSYKHPVDFYEFINIISTYCDSLLNIIWI